MAETGTVKWFNGKKGYGFLTRTDGEKDVFFHATDLRKSGIEDEDVDEGQKLSFELATTPRGLKAVKLSRVEADGNVPHNLNVESGGIVGSHGDRGVGVIPGATIPVPETEGSNGG